MDRLLSRKDLAQAWGVGLSTVRTLTTDPTFPAAIRLGRALRWEEADVRRWMDTRRERPRVRSRYRSRGGVDGSRVPRLVELVPALPQRRRVGRLVALEAG